MTKPVAVEGMTLAFSNPAVQGAITVIGPLSATLKAGGKCAVLDGCQVSVSAITYPNAGATTPDPGPYTVSIVASAQNMKADNKPVILEGDETDDITATPKIPGSPPIDNPVVFNVVVQQAGQSKLVTS